MGFFVCLAGLAAQLWLARKNRLLFFINLIVVLIIFVNFVSVAEYWFPAYRSRLPGRYPTWISALIQLWCFIIVCIGAALTVRDRVIPFQESRRRFFQASTAVICAAPVAAVSFGIISRKDFNVNEVDIKVPKLPPGLQNLRI